MPPKPSAGEVRGPALWAPLGRGSCSMGKCVGVVFSSSVNAVPPSVLLCRVGWHPYSSMPDLHLDRKSILEKPNPNTTGPALNLCAERLLAAVTGAGDEMCPHSNADKDLCEWLICFLGKLCLVCLHSTAETLFYNLP